MGEKLQILLVELVPKLMLKLTDLKFSEDYIYYLQLFCDKLLVYADGLGEKYMSQALQDGFIGTLYANAKKPSRDYALRCTDMLLTLHEYDEIFYKRASKNPFPQAFQDVYEAFLKEINTKVSGATQKTYRTNLMHSAKYLEERGVTSISEVTRENIIDFTTTLSRFGRSTAVRTLSLFSELLKYAHRNGYADLDASVYCMKVRIVEGEKIPPSFTKDEIARTMAAIDRATPAGKRDYAILMLASRTGLRPCDIKTLKLENLRFDTDTIEITQHKTGKMLVLSMLEEVGLAFIDYFKNGRTDVGSKYVFLRSRAPFKPFVSSYNELVVKYMERAGIENYKNRKPGLRSFRHSLASMMLENDVSIYDIKEQLGHETIDTTMRYVKIATKQLRKCALEVPAMRH